MKKLGMGVLWSGLYWSSPGPSRYRDWPTFTTLVHVQLRSRAEGNNSSTLFGAGVRGKGNRSQVSWAEWWKKQDSPGGSWCHHGTDGRTALSCTGWKKTVTRDGG